METGSSMIVGPSVTDRTTGAVEPSGASWMTTSASGSFTSSSMVWTESSVLSLTASFPPKLVGRCHLWRFGTSLVPSRWLQPISSSHQTLRHKRCCTRCRKATRSRTPPQRQLWPCPSACKERPTPLSGWCSFSLPPHDDGSPL